PQAKPYWPLDTDQIGRIGTRSAPECANYQLSFDFVNAGSGQDRQRFRGIAAFSSANPNQRQAIR
ncbi:MAG: hypothetical protein AAF483_21695, partial [Planctomycetota bacterium]